MFNYIMVSTFNFWKYFLYAHNTWILINFLFLFFSPRSHCCAPRLLYIRTSDRESKSHSRLRVRKWKYWNFPAIFHRKTRDVHNDHYFQIFVFFKIEFFVQSLWRKRERERRVGECICNNLTLFVSFYCSWKKKRNMTDTFTLSIPREWPLEQTLYFLFIVSPWWVIIDIVKIILLFC